MKISAIRQADQVYFEEREALAQRHPELGAWFIADQWPLLAGQVNIARWLAIYELLKRVIDLPGHWCEVGSWHGTNLAFMGKVLMTLRPDASTQVVGFEGFEGLPAFDAAKDGEARERVGHYRGDPALLADALRLYRLEERVTVVRGRVEETLPAFLRERPDYRLAFAYLDADLYSPTKVAIEQLYPRLVPGGIMVFDEYGLEQWPGETQAVHEVLGSHIAIHRVPHTRQPTAYVIKGAS